MGKGQRLGQLVFQSRMPGLYQIEYDPRVLSEDLPKLDGGTKKKIRRTIENRLLVDPEKYGLPLRRGLRNFRKLRVGDWRIVYRLLGKKIHVLAIAHRKDVYQHASGRLRI